ncbi:NADH-quinone oxidoreductase subunit M [Peribacillus deserti]|uniref:NADH-quinone oxidoreductase subunit M n=1 Tax=Peribacillus deserti TaxID=673318 RepID=A0ABS2QC42_9BACI|nr:NADH-quinone oxidoreductase subunit M [Peribacillus deserti]MBM7690699.1 NADH-quinone oxidoreductase subunit M [Peribacillus deserti]
MNEILLSVLVFSPLIGILALCFISKNQEKAIKWAGILATVPALALSLFLYSYYLGGNNLSAFSEKVRWIQFGSIANADSKLFAVDYELALDGFALLMVLLTAVLSTLSAIASISIKKEWKGYFMLFLLLETGMLGVFMAQNMVLFFIFFEITLIPAFFLIGKWGYIEKEKAAFSFLIYNGFGSAVLLIVIMVLFARAGTSNIEALRYIINVGGVPLVSPITEGMKYGLLIALLIAFGVKLPIFPLHTWMLRVHVQAPPPIVMLHAGVLLKIGAFGLIRFGLGIFPEQFKDLSVIIAVLGVINLLYGAFLAFIQKEFKMVLAYSSISHMGIVLIGLGALNESGIQGAIFQVVSHGLIAALLFFLVGVIYERVQTTSLSNLGGLSKAMPLTSGFLLAGAMASLGLPGMSGFISEFMAFLGLFKTDPLLAGIGALGIIITAVYLLRAVMGITFGKQGVSVRTKAMRDLNSVEMVPVLVLLAFIVIIGIYPSILSNPLEDTIQLIMTGLGGQAG